VTAEQIVAAIMEARDGEDQDLGEDEDQGPTDSKPLEELTRALATDLIRQRVLLAAGASTQASPSRAGCRPLID